MANIVGVRFKTAGKVYYFDPLDYDVRRGSHVIVETARGIEYGTVLVGPKEVPDDEVVQPLKAVIRVATDDDDARETYNRIREHEAYLICKEKISEHKLEMKLIKAEYTFDNNKLIFYFTADGRVDFRELVKDLAGVFRTRIELRQIGVRDETKLLGGVGICGRDLCCHTFLSGFAPVSIRMAKEQNLSLNPTKISGVCGRLMCCLKNEAETYEYLNSRLPRNGEWVTTPDGVRGEVYGTNVLRQLVKVVVQVDDEKDIRTYSVDELRFRSKGGGKKGKYAGPEQEEALQSAAEESPQTEAGPDGKTAEKESAREGSKKDYKKESKNNQKKDYRKDYKKDNKKDNKKDGKNASRKNDGSYKKNRNKNNQSSRSSSRGGQTDAGAGGKSKNDRNDRYDRRDTDKRKSGGNQNGKSGNTGSGSRNSNYRRKNNSRKNRGKSTGAKE